MTIFRPLIKVSLKADTIPELNKQIDDIIMYLQETDQLESIRFDEIGDEYMCVISYRSMRNYD